VLLGYIIFGMSLLHVEAQTRLGSLLTIIGAPVYIIGGISPASPIVSLIEIAGALPLGLGYILLGAKLHSGVNLQVAQQEYSSS
jgi:hypothetical protein